MKRFLILLSLLALILCACSEASFADLGAPAFEKYPEDGISRCPWDMIFWDGSLYIGGGDYDRNTGPVDLWRYDEAQAVWSLDATLPEEEISVFTVLSDGTLAVPGIDSSEDTRDGNYYILREGEWQIFSSLPGAVHNYDLAEHHGELFAACGVFAGRYPVFVNKDGTWREVRFVKDGAAVDTSSYVNVRCYEFFSLHGELYATLFLSGDGQELSYELYRYDGMDFVYFGGFFEKLSGVSFSYSLIADNAETDSGVYLATGELYFCADMLEFERIELQSGALVCDVMTCGEEVFVLTSNADKGGYRITLWKCRAGEKEFERVLSFDYDIPAVSLAASEKFFYIGMGNRVHDDEGELRGTVLSIKRR